MCCVREVVNKEVLTEARDKWMGISEQCMYRIE